MNPRSTPLVQSRGHRANAERARDLALLPAAGTTRAATVVSLVVTVSARRNVTSQARNAKRARSVRRWYRPAPGKRFCTKAMNSNGTFLLDRLGIDSANPGSVYLHSRPRPARLSSRSGSTVEFGTRRDHDIRHDQLGPPAVRHNRVDLQQFGPIVGIVVTSGDNSMLIRFRLVGLTVVAALIAIIPASMAPATAAGTTVTLAQPIFGNYDFDYSDPTLNLWDVSFTFHWGVSAPSGVCSQTLTYAGYGTLGGEFDPILKQESITVSLSKTTRSYAASINAPDYSRGGYSVVIRVQGCDGQTVASNPAQTVIAPREETDPGITYSGTWSVSHCACASGGPPAGRRPRMPASPSAPRHQRTSAA